MKRIKKKIAGDHLFLERLRESQNFFLERSSVHGDSRVWEKQERLLVE